jgi:membrane protein implicated in regulation of membrane protease activity
MSTSTLLTAVFVASLILGLTLAVRAMLYGVERRRAPFGAPAASSTPSIRFSTPVVSAFAGTFGAVGYLLTRPGRMGAVTGTIVAIVIGTVAGAFAVRIVRRAAAFVPEHDPDDPRYVLQGHVATVTSPISLAGEGEITYVVEGARHTVRARGLDGSVAERGTEVVIERIEDGVAYVEPWVDVEKRL